MRVSGAKNAQRHRFFMKYHDVSHRILLHVRTFIAARDCYTTSSVFRESPLANHPCSVKRSTKSGKHCVSTNQHATNVSGLVSSCGTALRLPRSHCMNHCPRSWAASDKPMPAKYYKSQTPIQYDLKFVIRPSRISLTEKEKITIGATLFRKVLKILDCVPAAKHIFKNASCL